MKKDYTHICIVLDSSGSMECVKEETKRTFNGFMDDQRKMPGKTTFDLFLFWNDIKRTVHFADIASYRDDPMAKYRCSGCTALHDAICVAIDSTGQDLSKMAEDERPEHVLVAIVTDGDENSSKRFTLRNVHERIKRQTEVYSWEFVFLGANIDAFATGQQLGIVMDNCVRFTQTTQGMEDLRSELNVRSEQIRNRRK